MPWDLACWGSSAARSGLTAMPVLAGETRLQLSGTNQLKPRGDGYLEMTCCRTAGIANLLQSRVHAAKDGMWWDHGAFFTRDQTGAVDPHAISIGRYPIHGGDLLEAQANNNNNAQVDVVLAAMVLGQSSPNLRRDAPLNLPPCKWIYGYATTTLTANSWSPAAMTWSETFDQSSIYKVYGMAAYSAGAYAARLTYTGGRSMGYVPGVPGGDTNLLNEPIYGDFGEFPGNMPPNSEWGSVSADTAEKIALLVTAIRVKPSSSMGGGYVD